MSTGEAGRQADPMAATSIFRRMAIRDSAMGQRQSIFPIGWRGRRQPLSNKIEIDPFSLTSAFIPSTRRSSPDPIWSQSISHKAEQLGLLDRERFAPEEQNLPIDDPRRVRTLQSHAVYAAMVEAMDQAVGVVLNRLTELDLDDHTAVIFMSDNGGLSTSEGSPTSNLPLRGGKGWLYEGGIREPLLIRWPQVATAGTVCDTPVISTDFYPTILDIAGVDRRPAQHLDGISLAPLLEGGRQPA